MSKPRSKTTAMDRAVLVGLGMALSMVMWSGIVVLTPGFLDNPTTWATFGDAFAPLAAFFGAVSVMLAVVAIMLQQQELAETREELSGQREAQAQLAAAQEAANAIARESNRLAAHRLELDRLQQELLVAELEMKGIADRFMLTHGTAVPGEGFQGRASDRFRHKTRVAARSQAAEASTAEMDEVSARTAVVVDEIRRLPSPLLLLDEPPPGRWPGRNDEE